MIWEKKNYLFEKILVINFSKWALIYRMKIPDAWYSAHTIAKYEMNHNCVISSPEPKAHKVSL